MTTPAVSAYGRVRGLIERWAGDRSLRVIAANTGWLVFDKLGRALVGLLVGAWVARHLGPSEYGTLAFVLAYIALFLPLANLSADQIVVRNVSQALASQEEILGSALALRLTLGVACWALAVAGVAVFDGDNGRLILLTAIVGGTLIFQAADVVDLWFQSQTQSRRTVAAKLVAYLTSNAIKVALILSEASVAAFAAVTALEGLLGALALAAAYRRFRTSRAWGLNRKTCADVARQASPLMLTGLAIMAYMRVDQILVKEVLGAHELGLYAAILPLSQFWQMLPMTIATSVAPFVARRRQADPEGYRRTIVLLMRLFFYAGVATTLATYAVSGWLVPTLFGDAYAPAVLALDVHVVSNVFCFLGLGASLWLVNEHRTASMLYATIAGGIASVALNLVLLPHIGLVGACLAAIAAQAVASFAAHAWLNPALMRLQLEAITFRRYRP